jgi:hypothetical protein
MNHTLSAVLLLINDLSADDLSIVRKKINTLITTKKSDVPKTVNVFNDSNLRSEKVIIPLESDDERTNSDIKKPQPKKPVADNTSKKNRFGEQLKSKHNSNVKQSTGLPPLIPMSGAPTNSGSIFYSIPTNRVPDSKEDDSRGKSRNEDKKEELDRELDEIHRSYQNNLNVCFEYISNEPDDLEKSDKENKIYIKSLPYQHAGNLGPNPNTKTDDRSKQPNKCCSCRQCPHKE